MQQLFSIGRAEPLTFQRKLIPILVGVCLCTALPANAEKLYKVVDENGNISYQDRPPADAEEKVEEKHVDLNHSKLRRDAPPKQETEVIGRAGTRLPPKSSNTVGIVSDPNAPEIDEDNPGTNRRRQTSIAVPVQPAQDREEDESDARARHQNVYEELEEGELEYREALEAKARQQQRQRPLSSQELAEDIIETTRRLTE